MKVDAEQNDHFRPNFFSIKFPDAALNCSKFSPNFFTL